MIELRVIGSSDDSSLLLLSDKPRGRKGSFAIPIDRELLEVLQAAVYARREGVRKDRLEDLPESAPSSFPGPKVPPREIQRLLRAGMTVDRVADVLDCDQELVERFETPILYERNGVIKDVQRLFVEKSRLGISGLNVRASIETNLASRRIRLTDDEYLEGWHATREEGQPWKVSYTFDFRGKQVARFDYEPRLGSIEATNKAALDLAWVPAGTVKPNIPPPMPGTKRKRPASGRPPAKRKPVAKKKPVARKPVAKKKPVARKPVAKKKPVARKPVARKPVARKTAAKRTPAKRTPAKRAATKRAAPKRTSSRSSASKRRSPRR